MTKMRENQRNNTLKWRSKIQKESILAFISLKNIISCTIRKRRRSIANKNINNNKKSIKIIEVEEAAEEAVVDAVVVVVEEAEVVIMITIMKDKIQLKAKKEQGKILQEMISKH